MFRREVGEGGETVVTFSGVLDAKSAREVHPLLCVEPPSKLTLDLSQATEVDNCGLAILAVEIDKSRCAVLLRGLRAGQIRLLRYLGFDLDRLGLAPRLASVS
jgi:anti-anti-sigma regulatory factor